MKKILLGALVCAAVAGIVAYAISPEKVNESLADLKKKAEDLLGQAREGAETMRDEAGTAMG
ncbi:YtxH domain-containing protein [Flaviaesturariibacter flavus]|uniref:YtxH domain-containing protein n=1 Tax=Flaviaesturariibacter flavus TaxID=2502780 RepID=A0A4R1B4U9_9BACT|nr:YtxH domain-containing protein [Flaviaesturariibacter flavus]TCJ13142.1 YtxH domain-containing protein [Flaviaesturariibacter flavus]